MSDFRMSLDRSSRNGFVEIDGQRLGNVRSVEITASVSGKTTVTLCMRPRQTELDLADPIIQLDEATRGLLESLGWTAPGGCTCYPT